MEAPKAPQFTAYDFLGYIVPGLVLIFLGDISYQFHFANHPLSYDQILSRYGSLSWASLIPLILVAYFVGHMTSFVSSMTIERHAGWMHGLPGKLLLYNLRPAYLDTAKSRSPIISKLIRICIFFFLLPIAVIEVIFGKWCGLAENYFRPVDLLVRTAFLKSMSRLLNNLGLSADNLAGTEPWEYELERIAIHCAVERAPMHVQTLRNYVVLYGFLRSMCLILVLAFWIGAFHLLLTASWNLLSVYSIIGSLLVFLCYAAFLKFWFRYYFEAIMAIIAISTLKKSESSAASGSSNE